MVAIILLLAAAAASPAQEPNALPDPGTRVRITHPCEPRGAAPPDAPARACRTEGHLILATPDSVSVANGAAATYRVAQVTRFEASTGRRSHWKTGAIVGFAAGAGATLAVLTGGSGPGSLCDYSRDQDAMGWKACAGLAGVGGVIVGAMGAGVGAAIRTHRWRDVPLRARGPGAPWHDDRRGSRTETRRSRSS